MRVAGIMSGTSLDGIDVAIVDITGRGWNKRVRTIAVSTAPYPEKVRKALMGVSNCETHTAQIALLNFLLPELYAEAVKKLAGPESLDLVGCHGQTILHIGQPSPFLGRRVAATLQIGDGSILAERLGVPVVSDFRPRDMAAGGQGAPLVPYMDYLLFRHKTRTRVALNLGGIGNITVIPAGATPDQVIAFDTGPANMVIDQLIERHTNGRQRYDRNGATGRRGKVNEPLLKQLLRNPYYRKPAPKSCGREEYGAEFVNRMQKSDLPMEDLIATATALTARTVALAMPPADDLIAGGGGTHNAFLMDLLRQALPNTRVTTTAEFGVDPDAKEAIAFAVLAHEAWHKQPNNLPSATGARHPVIMGKISR